MSNDKLKIPTNIKVGYNKRDDTYTGKLAYIIYIDEKGKLRKEPSWNSWRDKNLGENDYDNVPTSGFVLNKKVGDYRGSWDGRMAWIRIYDPRGFEFEITVANLLYILEECTSTKGKGLEGEFVYAWDAADLVLLPVSSQEYQSSKVFTAAQSGKVTKADMKEGRVYLTKKMESVVYLGKQVWHSFDDKSYYRDDKPDLNTLAEEKHIFYFIDRPKNENEYRYTSVSPYTADPGFTKLSSKVSDEVVSNYADIYDTYKKSFEGGGIKEYFMVQKPGEKEDNYFYSYPLLMSDGALYKMTTEYGAYWSISNKQRIKLTHKIEINGNIIKYTEIPAVYKDIDLLKNHQNLYKIKGRLHNNKETDIRI